MAGASSHISEEMIELSFLECFQIMMFLCYFFVTTSPVFCFLFFFFFFFFQSTVQIGVRIIHGRALYMGKYGKWQGIDLHPFYRSLGIFSLQVLLSC